MQNVVKTFHKKFKTLKNAKKEQEFLLKKRLKVFNKKRSP